MTLLSFLFYSEEEDANPALQFIRHTNGGESGNRIHHNLLAKQIRLLGTCPPILVGQLGIAPRSPRLQRSALLLSYRPILFGGRPGSRTLLALLPYPASNRIPSRSVAFHAWRKLRDSNPHGVSAYLFSKQGPYRSGQASMFGGGCGSRTRMAVTPPVFETGPLPFGSTLRYPHPIFFRQSLQ